MFIAEDEKGKRIVAEKGLPRDVAYFCPVCHSQVRLRAGDNNAAHFAHMGACLDDFTHDMSEWHREWQNLFPLNNREKVITYENETHRADVQCYGTVIEFQHSPISESEFNRRNRFYTAAGYKVVWIFDLTELYSGYDTDGRLYYSGEWTSRWGQGGKFTWKHPWRFLGGFLPQEEIDIDVFFHITPFKNNPKSDEADAYMERVVWIDPNYKTLWGQFRTSSQVGNYHDLLAWLKERWLKTQKPVNNNRQENRRYKYQVEGRIIEPQEFDEFLRQNQPYHVLEVGQRNSPYGTGQFGEPKFWCPDPHQKPCIQEGHCTLGCWACLAVEEVSKYKHLIYCKSPLAKGEKFDAKIFRRVYK